MIILDFGSATTCKNDIDYVKKMIDELKAVDTNKHEIVIKWQLFTEILYKGTPVPPLNRDVFNYAYHYARKLGYKTTASVFDKDSLDYLLTYDIPFVKLANRPELYWLAGEVPRKVPVYMSTGYLEKVKHNLFDEILTQYSDITMVCISKYPATIDDYEKEYVFYGGHALINISDHTTDFTLYHKYKPDIYEVHYRLTDSTGPDSGEFARTPEQLAEVL